MAEHTVASRGAMNAAGCAEGLPARKAVAAAAVERAGRPGRATAWQPLLAALVRTRAPRRSENYRSRSPPHLQWCCPVNTCMAIARGS